MATPCSGGVTPITTGVVKLLRLCLAQGFDMSLVVRHMQAERVFGLWPTRVRTLLARALVPAPAWFSHGTGIPYVDIPGPTYSRYRSPAVFLALVADNCRLQNPRRVVISAEMGKAAWPVELLGYGRTGPVVDVATPLFLRHQPSRSVGKD